MSAEDRWAEDRSVEVALIVGGLLVLAVIAALALQPEIAAPAAFAAEEVAAGGLVATETGTAVVTGEATFLTGEAGLVADGVGLTAVELEALEAESLAQQAASTAPGASMMFGP